MVSSKALQDFKLFQGLEDSFLEALATAAESVPVEADQWLFQEGDYADALYVIKSGRVELKVKLDEKREIFATLNTLSEGQPLGWSAMFEPYIYKLGAVAATQAQLLKFDGKQLQALVENQPDQGYIFMQRVAQGMAERAVTIREEMPALSLRLVISNFFMTLSLVTVVFAVIAVLFGIYVAATTSVDSIVMPLLCLVVPAALYVIAKVTYPSVTVHSS